MTGRNATSWTAIVGINRDRKKAVRAIRYTTVQPCGGTYQITEDIKIWHTFYTTDL